ncbi:hypothetical protein GA0070606_0471 [Micromonospora citrea]|uniref:Uncharacterized protein n=1 Tax=Micromonospora citrea TaxID=47855 RepID=A0A1C6TSV0_9ACTN|nr:hypothetical protein GA0070606_0471 [Micromonospora citrea]
MWVVQSLIITAALASTMIESRGAGKGFACPNLFGSVRNGGVVMGFVRWWPVSPVL